MAFPTTSALLDAFNRANEGPPPSASWENVVNGCKVVGNTLGGNIVTNPNQSSFKPIYTSDVEVIATVAVKPVTNGQYMGLAARWATGGVNTGYIGYFVTQAGTDTWEIYKVTAGSYVLLGAAVTGPEVTVGDKVGLEIIGSTINLYHFTAGSWSLVMTRTDATFTGAGYIGAYIDSTSAAWDDFSGGPPRTFGKTTIGATLTSIEGGYEQVSKFTLGTSQTINKLTIYLDGNGTGSGAGQVMKGIIYSNTAGEPDALLATSEEVNVPDLAAAAWIDFTITAPVALTAADYWLGLHAGNTGNVARFGTDAVTNNRKYKARAYASGPLNPWGVTEGTDDTQIDVYATWSDAVVGSGNPIFRLGRGSAW